MIKLFRNGFLGLGVFFTAFLGVVVLPMSLLSASSVPSAQTLFNSIDQKFGSIAPVVRHFQETITPKDGVPQDIFGTQYIDSTRKKEIVIEGLNSQIYIQQDTTLYYIDSKQISFGQFKDVISATRNVDALKRSALLTHYTWTVTEVSGDYRLSGVMKNTPPIPQTLVIVINKQTGQITRQTHFINGEVESDITYQYQLLDGAHWALLQETELNSSGVLRIREYTDTLIKYSQDTEDNWTFESEFQIIAPNQPKPIQPDQGVFGSFSSAVVGVGESFGIESMSSETPEYSAYGGSTYLKAVDSFSVGEINLTNGSLSFEEVDLELPGINGLNLKIARNYQSVAYQSNVNIGDNDGQWGGYMGKGWSFGSSKRAYHLGFNQHRYQSFKKKPPKDRIVIEDGDGVEIYEWSDSVNAFTSSVPGNSNKAYYNASTKEISLVTTVGIKLLFSEYGYHEFQEIEFKISGKRYREKLYEVTGAMLTGIQDLQGNRIQYQYETIGDPIHRALERGRTSIGHTIRHSMSYIKKSIISKDLQGVIDLVGDPKIVGRIYRYGVHSTIPRKRLKSITDSFNRIVEVKYNESHNQWVSEQNLQRPYMITSIRYKNTLGTQSSIKYSYTNQGLLESVQKDDLPKREYRYQYVDLGLKKYSKLSLRPLAQYDLIPPSDFQRSLEYDKYDGNVLSQIIEPLGEVKKYYYQPAYAQGPKYDSDSQDENDHLAIRMPIVIKKEVFESSQDFSPKVTAIAFPKDGNGLIRNTASSYIPSWFNGDQDYTSYFFSKVIVTTPSEIENEEYYFESGKLTKKVKGTTTETFKFDPVTGVKLSEKVDTSGVLQSRSEYLSYDQYLNPTLITHYDGDNQKIKTVSLTYQTPSNTNLLSLISTESTTWYGDGPSFTFQNRYTYDDFGKELSHYRKAQSSNWILSKQTTYDSKGRIETETVPLPTGTLTRRLSYSISNGLYTITTQANGSQSSASHELNTGLPTQTIDIHGNQSTTTYDQYGRVLSETGPDRNTKQFTYSSDLKEIRLVYLGQTATQRLDGFGRLTETLFTDGSSDQKTVYYFGSTPKATYRKKNGSWDLVAQYTYDTRLRPIQKTTPDFGTTYYDYAPDLRWTRVTGADGRRQTTYLNGRGETIRTEDSARNRDFTYRYSSTGVQTSLTDERGLTHEKTLDQWGRVHISYHPYSGSGPKVKASEVEYFDSGETKTIYTYDQSGQLNKTLTHDYDQDGRLTNTYINGQLIYSTAYGTSGTSFRRPEKITTQEVEHRFSYDTLGRVNQEQVKGNTPIPYDVTHEYGYTSKGQLDHSSFPDGTKLNYTYDQSGRLISVMYKSIPIVTYTYASDGKLSSSKYSNGTDTHYTYLKDTFIGTIQVKGKNGELIYDESNQYDITGSMTSTSQLNVFDPHYLALDSQVPKRTTNYTYTPKKELHTVTYRTQSPSPALDMASPKLMYRYKYDGNGNWNEFEPSTTSPKMHTYKVKPNSDQLTEVVSPDGMVTKITYDGSGNLIQKADSNTVTNYTYTLNGQLESVSKNGKQIALYKYDANRHRIYSSTTSHTGETTQVLSYWQNGYPIAEKTSSSDRLTKYIYQGNTKIAVILPDPSNPTQEVIHYLHTTLQGTTVAITNEKGQVIHKQQTDPYGNIEKAITPTYHQANVTFTGKTYDPVTGLYYFHQRYYDPDLGRFLTPDPKGQYINPYVYADNNPIMYVDPNGEWALAVLKAALVAMAVNASVQLIVTGQIDMNQVLQAGVSGALSAGIFYAVGSFSTAVGLYEGSFGRIVLHTLAGGYSSQLQGGDFNSGAIGAGVSQGFSPKINALNSATTRVLASAGVGAVSAWAIGGNAYHGALSAGFGRMFNCEMHDGKDQAGNPMGRMYRSMLREQYGVTPSEFPEYLLKSGYDSVNDFLSDPKTYAAAKTTLALTTRYVYVQPQITIPVISVLTIYVNYSEFFPPGPDILPKL